MPIVCGGSGLQFRFGVVEDVRHNIMLRFPVPVGRSFPLLVSLVRLFHDLFESFIVDVS